MSRECDGVLDRGIAATHYDDVFAAHRIGRLERVLYARQLGTGDLQAARVAVQAQRQDDVPGADLFAGLQAEPEITPATRDLDDLGGVADVDLRALQILLPGMQH